MRPCVITPLRRCGSARRERPARSCGRLVGTATVPAGPGSASALCLRRPRRQPNRPSAEQDEPEHAPSPTGSARRPGSSSRSWSRGDARRPPTTTGRSACTCSSRRPAAAASRAPPDPSDSAFTDGIAAYLSNSGCSTAAPLRSGRTAMPCCWVCTSMSAPVVGFDRDEPVAQEEVLQRHRLRERRRAQLRSRRASGAARRRPVRG